jgi:hypothetical protein
MEMTYSTETPVDLQWNTLRCILEDQDLDNRRENVKSYVINLYFRYK